jgi:hypothetical protein
MAKRGHSLVYEVLLFSMLSMSISAPMNKLAIAGGMPADVINFAGGADVQRLHAGWAGDTFPLCD